MRMLVRLLSLAVVILGFAASTPFVFAGDTIPKVAWKRGIGEPLENPGGRKPALAQSGMIDDGYWQGAPVGGFGAGTFSRSYRGDFVRWHMKAGIHKYQSIPANQFSVFVKPEGGKAIAEVLCAGMPKSDGLSTWNWSYPAGSGEYAALYPKAWFDYHSQELPVHLVLEQFSPVLPDNYKESSYPVALYNWYASNDTQQTETVSIMFSWTNMVGWFRDTSPNFDNVINAQNTNHFRSQPMQNGAMKGIVFDRVRSNNVVQEEWDGQFAIAALETPGVEVSYVNTFLPQSDGSEVWKPFSTTGTLPNTNQSFT